MARRKKPSITTRLVLTFGLVMLAANIFLGLVALNQSKNAMQTLIDKNMLDVTNSAAALIDGDVLGALTAEDVGGEGYSAVYDALTVFRKNVDIRFIYAVRREDDGRFVFTVDPDPDEPAEFGEEIVVTNGLKKAADGVPAVDDAPMADRWGNFYSAFSPVLDSRGNVAGVIGIDFDAEWYDAQVREHTVSMAVVTALSVLVGIVAVFLITGNVRRQIRTIERGLAGLSQNVDKLMSEVSAMSGYTPKSHGRAREGAPADELAELGGKIRGMQADMLVYLDYLRKQARVDALTQVQNSTAYHEALEWMDARIGEGTAEFVVAVFDINSLKEINDEMGHPCGDFIICGAARAIAEAFGAERTYRIGGDEFAVIGEGVTDEALAEALASVDAAVDAFNRGDKPFDVTLAVSKGTARFRPGVDADYRAVFARADKTMYAVKKAYYESAGSTA